MLTLWIAIAFLLDEVKIMGSKVVDINVGGVNYTTTMSTLTLVKGSLLTSYFSDEFNDQIDGRVRDSRGTWFIDRDGILFRYILDYLRNRRIILPDNFSETQRLINEAEYYRLPELVKVLRQTSCHRILSPLVTNNSLSKSTSGTELSERTGTITVSYRGTFAFGRDGLADVKFRKIIRLLVCGKVTLCRAVFGEALNESRDPDRGDSERYTSRFFLKHNFLEQAFDNLLDAGFILSSCAGTGTNSIPLEGTQPLPAQTGKGMSGSLSQDSEEGRWYHYNEFIWVKS